MHDPAAARDFLKCMLCHSHTRRDIAGEPARCSSCGALVSVIAGASPIVARRTFQSASLLRNNATPSLPGPGVAHSPAASDGRHANPIG